MLTITIPCASEMKLTETVVKCCGLYGTVTRVKVYAIPSSPSMHPFALVAMDTRENAERLAAAFGGRTIGRITVIHLQMPAGAAAPLPEGTVEST